MRNKEDNKAITGTGGLACADDLDQADELQSSASYILFVREDVAKVSREVTRTMLAKRAQGASGAAA